MMWISDSIRMKSVLQPILRRDDRGFLIRLQVIV